MSNKPLVWLLSLTLLLVLGVGWQVTALSKAINTSVADRPRSEEKVTTVTWISGGMTITHTASPKPDETPAQFAARLRAEVDALKVQFPQDP